MLRFFQITLLMILLTGQMVTAQVIANLDFENWSFTDTTWDGQPIYQLNSWNDDGAQGWWMSGPERTTESQSGHYAAMLSPVMGCGISPNCMVYGKRDNAYLNVYYPPYTFGASGAPINYKPTQLNGYYKMDSSDQLDSARGIVVLKKFNTATQQSEVVGEGFIAFAPTATYTPFSIHINDLQPNVTPDSIVIAFVSGTGFFFDTTGIFYVSRLFIDHIWLEGNALGVDNTQQETEAHIYPNPSRDILNVSFTSTRNDNFRFTLTDMSGRQILQQSIVPGQVLPVNVSPFPAGNYIGTIIGSDKIYFTQKIIVGEECVY